MAMGMIKRDEFFSTIESVRVAIEQNRKDFMEVATDTRDLVKTQNGKLYQTVTTVGVLEERINNLSQGLKDVTTSMKDNPSRWMSGGALLGLALEIIRHLVTSGKLAP